MLCCSCFALAAHPQQFKNMSGKTVFYLLYSHEIAERDGTREKEGITSHQLSLYTAKVLLEHTLDTVPDSGSTGPGGSRAPKSKRAHIWY